MNAPRPLRAVALVLLFCAACLGQVRAQAQAQAQALTIAIAPIAVIDAQSRAVGNKSRFEDDLLGRLSAIPLGGALFFARSRECDAAPASLLEAARLCERGSHPFLLYGYLRSSEGMCYSELKLLSREGKRIVAAFASADDEDHYPRLVGDLAAKIVRYFADDLALLPEARDSVSRNVFELSFSLGCWTPAGDWAEPMAGIARAEIGLRLIPKEPLGAIGSRPWSIAAAPRIEYALGISRPGYETSSLHRLSVRFPVEACLGVGSSDLVRASAGVLVGFDILSQERKYGSRLVETAVAGGLCASVAYFRGLSDRLRVGLSCGFDAVFYDDPLYSFSPSISIDYRLGGVHD